MNYQNVKNQVDFFSHHIKHWRDDQMLHISEIWPLKQADSSFKKHIKAKYY